jgi:uncharacterized protein (TIGR03067 family)
MRISVGLMRLTAFAVVVGTCAPGRGDDKDGRAAARKDLEQLQGTWTVVSMEREGEPIPAEQLEGRTCVYEKDAFTLKSGDQPRRRGIVTLDPSRKLKAINTWDLDGPYTDATVPGIYELAGDTLRLCFSRPGAERPTEFSTKSGGGLLMVVYQRKK